MGRGREHVSYLFILSVDIQLSFYHLLKRLFSFPHYFGTLFENQLTEMCEFISGLLIIVC